MLSPRVRTLRDARREKNVLIAMFLFPTFLLLSIFIFYSIFNNFQISFYDWDGLGGMDNFIGLQNWSRLLSDSTFWRAAVNNIQLVFISIFIELPIGLALAYFLDIYGKKVNFFKIGWFLPLLMSSTAIGTLFSFFLDNYFGPIAGFLNLFNIQMPTLLGSTTYALYAVGFAIVWQFTPFYMVYYLAGLSSIPEELYEASVIDGAKRSQYFFRIALPILSPTIRNAIVLQLIGSLKYFDLIYVMTGGGPSGATELMATYMYRQSFLNTRMGYGATVAGAMFIIITTLALITVKFLNRKEG